MWRPESTDAGLKSSVDALSKQLQWIIELQTDIKKNTAVQKTIEAKEVNANAGVFQDAFEKMVGFKASATVGGLVG